MGLGPQPITLNQAMVGPGALHRRLEGGGEAALRQALAPGLLSPPAPKRKHL